MAVSASSPRLHFEPDYVPLPTSPDNVEQASPPLSSSTALARFEFESGRGNEGTKILMVEWEDDTTEGSAKNMGDWEVSWEGKSTVLSARDGAEGKLHRLYFLLAPGASIPRIIKLSQVGRKTIQTNPLPAIFPPELGLTARQAGRKGVLHTIWAKKRISVLQREIEEEMKTNGEGVGLEMAIQERQWIEENFGVGPKITQSDIQHNATPASPKTPGGGRLSEKLKGLKLGTSAQDLSNVPESKFESHLNPLSPEQGDVAVSSFSLFHGATARPQPLRLVAQHPPNHVSQPGMNSLNALATGGISQKTSDEDQTGDELFAIKMSPRSPEMTKSPFSFAIKDVALSMAQKE
ncbi:17a5ea3a-2ef5-4c93-86a9-9a06d475843f [Sclerotinia trifoliorum]|uniref:17a5ea3a-2ef5-4c93-86a9-9a06d475843f n=1 Tax=Sclerotinia trifoliorum TaxID=28548 RepID=A0A8H2VL22_9HELO|nr:17a5ea3a-2ef5-4c93-86a9-9a06d475843f [Sclerotinia trifoliorum]